MIKSSQIAQGVALLELNKSGFESYYQLGSVSHIVVREPEGALKSAVIRQAFKSGRGNPIVNLQQSDLAIIVEAWGLDYLCVVLLEPTIIWLIPFEALPKGQSFRLGEKYNHYKLKPETSILKVQQSALKMRVQEQIFKAMQSNHLPSTDGKPINAMSNILEEMKHGLSTRP